MKTKPLYFALSAFTVAAVLAYPAEQANLFAAANPAPAQAPSAAPANPDTRPQIDVVFVLDTTGSMGGLIQAAKEKIWSIATSMAQARPAPVIRIGLVAYRDRGDDYVTKVVDLSTDLDGVYAKLMDFSAAGGGDGPESVNQGLYDAVHAVSWSQNPKAYKAVFLVGDAPPHMDYPDDVKYADTLKTAQQRGIVVNTIQCGDETATSGEWRQIAQLGQGQYVQVGQAGGAVAVATPYDKKLAELSAKMDATRLYYGDAREKAKTQAKQDAAAKLNALSSVESRARRATFNASDSGAANRLGDKELVEEVSQGRVDLSKIDRDQLPAPMQAMPPAARQALVEEKAQERAELKQQIDELASQRAAHIKAEMDQRGGAKDSLDQKLFGAVREQAGKKGLRYESSAPAY